MSYFLPLISESLEALEQEQGPTTSRSSESEQEAAKLLEELVRCELMGIEKNPFVFENLNKLVRKFSLLLFEKGITETDTRTYSLSLNMKT